MRRYFVVLIAGLLFLSFPSQAATYTWKSNLATGNWDDANSWIVTSPDGPANTTGPGPADLVIIPTNAIVSFSGNAPTAVSITQLTLSNGASLQLGSVELTTTDIGITNGSVSGTGGVKVASSVTARSIFFTNTTFSAPLDIQLTGTSSAVTFGTGCVFGTVSSTAATLLLNGSKFNGVASLTKTGASNDLCNGNNHFYEQVTIANAGSGVLYLSNGSIGDEFVKAATFVMLANSTGRIYVAHNAVSSFANGLTIKNLGASSLISLGRHSTLTGATQPVLATVVGDIVLESSGTGSTASKAVLLGDYGNIQQTNGVLVANSSGFTNGRLHISNVLQSFSNLPTWPTNAVVLGGNAGLYLKGCNLPSAGSFEAPAIFEVKGNSIGFGLGTTQTAFSTYLIDNGDISNTMYGSNPAIPHRYWTGGNFFYGALSIKHHGGGQIYLNTTQSGSGMLVDEYHGLVTVEAGEGSTGYTFMANNAQGIFKKGITINNLGSASVIHVAKTTLTSDPGINAPLLAVINGDITVNSYGANPSNLKATLVGLYGRIEQSNGTIKVGTFSNGRLHLRRIKQLFDATPIPNTIALTGSASLYLNFNEFPAGCTVTAPAVYDLQENKFGTLGQPYESAITDEGNTSVVNYYSNATDRNWVGGNKFFGKFTLVHHGGGTINMTAAKGDAFYGDLVLTNSSSAGITTGIWGPTSVASTQQNGRIIANFSAGTLLINRFSQTFDAGNTSLPNDITFGGPSGVLGFWGCNFPRGGTFTAPYITNVYQSTFGTQGQTYTTTFTDNGTSTTTRTWNGGNKFYGKASFNYGGKGTFYTSYTYGDDFFDDVEYNLTAQAGTSYLAYKGNTNYYKNVTYNSLKATNAPFNIPDFGNGQSTTEHLSFVGSTDQTLSIASTFTNSLNFQNLKVNKPSGKLFIDHAVQIFGVLNLVAGNLVMLNEKSIYITWITSLGTSSKQSFIDGKISRWIGPNETALFPTGSGSTYRPIRAGMTTGYAATVTVRYYPTMASSVTSKTAPLLDLSPCEYWQVQRGNSTGGNVSFSLLWDENALGVGCSPIKTTGMGVARQDPTTQVWSMAGTTLTGNATAGNVTTPAAAPPMYVSPTNITFGYTELLAVPGVVTNNNDAGTGSLRAAIEWANSNADVSTITFKIPSQISKEITLVSELPPIVHPVTIDGTSQTDYVATNESTIVKVKGTGTVPKGLLLQGNSHNSVIKGLNFLNFIEYGVWVESEGVELVDLNVE